MVYNTQRTKKDTNNLIVIVYLILNRKEFFQNAQHVEIANKQ
jgi:hypothetical protein